MSDNVIINKKSEEFTGMIIKVLDRATLGFDLDLSPLNKFGTVEIYDKIKREAVANILNDAEVIIINKIKINEEVLKNAKKLKLICVFATGFDNVDISCAKKYGVAVCNIPAYSTDSVALFTVANVLYLFTHLGEYRDFVNSGEYSQSGMANRLIPVYHEIKGKVWGIIGLGNIGRKVAEIASALGANVIVNKLTPTEDYKCVDIDTLCKESDIITVHCPLTSSTKKMIDAEKISLMKKEVVLFNSARGAVTDEEAVAQAIINGQIGAFGSDVYSVEPFDEEHPFWQIMNFKNVSLTPHSAWGAYEARVRAFNIVCENIKSFIDGKTLNRVDK